MTDSERYQPILFDKLPLQHHGMYDKWQIDMILQNQHPRHPFPVWLPDQKNYYRSPGLLQNIHKGSLQQKRTPGSLFFFELEKAREINSEYYERFA